MAFLGRKGEVRPHPAAGLFRYVRKEMLIGLPIIYLLCYLAAAVIVPFFAGRIATSTASFIIGGEVAVKEISRVSLNVGMLVFNELYVDEARFHVVQEQDGTMNIDNFTTGWNA